MNETSNADSWIHLRPESFSFKPEKWEFWKARFLRFLSISNQSENSDKEKIDLLIYCMGEQAKAIYKQFLKRTRTFGQALRRFDAYFNTDRPLGCFNAAFYNRVQQEGEPVENFLIDLQRILNKCEIDFMKDLTWNVILRDKIISGLKDIQLCRQLQLEDDLTLEETIKIIKEAEEREKHKDGFPGTFRTSEAVAEPIPSTSSSQNSNYVVSSGFDNGSSDDRNQVRLGFFETVPGVSSVKQEPTENEENYENNVNLDNLTDNPHRGQELSIKEEEMFESDITIDEMNLKVEDAAEEEAPSFMDNNFEIDPTAEFSSNLACGSREVDVRQHKRQKKSCIADHNYSENELNTETPRFLINILNDDCLLNIFNYLTIRDLIRIERVCERWRKISLASWRKVKNLDITTEFKTKTIQSEQLEGLLRRSGNYITRFDCSWLDKSTHLPPITTMENISNYCKKLTHLDISYTWNKRNYLEGLSADLLKNLKSLTLGSQLGYTFSDDHLPALLEIAVNLEEFGIDGYDYTGNENRLLNLSTNCKMVSITNSNKFSNRMLMELLENHPNIEHVDISATAITPDALFPFTNRLKSLALWEMENFFEVDLRAYESLKCPNLRILDMSINDFDLTGEILKIIVENCPGIEDLRLKRAKALRVEDFTHLKKLRNLKYLDVSQTKITDPHAVGLAEESKQLKKFFCYGSRISQSGLTKIVSASPELSYLAIYFKHLTKSLVSSILDCLNERKNKVWLTISVRSQHTQDRRLEIMKPLDLKNGIEYHNKTNVLRIVNGVNRCQCSFNKPCICIEDEDTIYYFG